MEKKEKVYQFIHENTLKKIKEQQLHSLGLDALNISLDLQMDRANISRILNQLYNEGRVIKTASRPVLFIDRRNLDFYFHDSHIPSIIPKNKTISDYISNKTNKHVKESLSSFRQYITNPRHSKMYEPIKRAKASILYPNGLNTLIFGENGSGRFQFAKSLFDYAKEVKFIDKNSKLSIIECLNYNTSNEDFLLTLLFGEYISKNDTFRRGIFQSSQNNIIILNNIDKMPSQVASALFNAILDQSFSPINSNKTFHLNSLIIATATNQSILSNIEIRRCFPMLINIPNLNERSIVEKLVIILQYLQEEATIINKTIRISKDALSCFAMSEYKGNLAHLRAEIRQACALGYETFINEHSFFIDIGFDEISTPVLNNIFNVNERLQELYNTLDLFTNDYLFFSTNKPNPELSLLYDLNYNKAEEEITSLQKIDEEIVNQCIADIDNASRIKLNSIRSILLQKIYDTVYPLLEGHKIHKNENLLYGLLLHISNEINKYTNNKPIPSPYAISTKIARENDYTYANKIINKIMKKYNIILPNNEIDYIATYLYLSSQWIDKRYIQILILSSNKEIARTYTQYMNSQYSKTHTFYAIIPINLKDLENSFNKVIEQLYKIDRGKGVIIISDSPHTQFIQNLLVKQYRGEYALLTNLSVQKLVSIAEKIESLGVTIHSISAFSESTASQTIIKNYSESHVQELLSDIQDKVLSESLVFLNPEKGCQSLFNVFQNILNDLQIQYSDDLLIKFMFHTAFTLERCIRKESFAYPKARYLINQNENLFNILDRNFKIINEIFAVQIPISEMGYIIEIFLPYLS